MRDRVVGSLVGLAVGDALGTTIEFQDRDSYEPITDITGGGPFRLNPGEWTDDTSMALCLAQALVVEPSLDEVALLKLFRSWYKDGLNSVKDHCFDIGSTTLSGINSWVSNGTVINNFKPHQAGNGGIMRLAPAAMVAWQDAKVASNIAVRQSETTHAGLECVHSAAFAAQWLVNLYQGKLDRPVDSAWCSSVQTIATGDYSTVHRDHIYSSGYVIHTLEAAVWATLTSNSFEEAVLKAVNLGEDADTVGAVTGQFAGARWGLSNIPAQWVECLHSRDQIIDLSHQLYQLGEARAAANYIS